MPHDEPLAILGGQPAVTHAAAKWPGTSASVQRSILQLLEQGEWGSYTGAVSDELAAKMAALSSHSQAILVSSGTIAVELALRGLLLNPGEEVILAGYDFPGNFRAIEAVGAVPVLVDTIRSGWTLDPQLVASAGSEKTRAVIASHLHGTLADMRTIRSVCDANQWHLVEDCCQVPGATMAGQPVGKFGHVSVWSFGGSKLLSAGRGGAIASSNEEILARIRTFSYRGNEAFPLSQLQAAAVLPQLDELPALTQKRHASATYLLSLLADEPALLAPHVSDLDVPAYYKLAWHLADEWPAEMRPAIIRALQAEGIAIDEGFRGFAKRSSRRCRVATSLASAARSADRTLVLHHPALLQSHNFLEQIALGIKKVFCAMRRGDWPPR